MKRFFATVITLLVMTVAVSAPKYERPWSRGPLRASADGQRFEHTDGTPFFWLGDTGWLLPERLNRDEAAGYLFRAAGAGFNVIQVQTVNGVPAFNIYGAMSHPDGWDFSNIDRPGEYGYWDHMDFIVDMAANYGIYIAMDCIWGGLVKAGLMTEDNARAYGKFLGERYANRPNIVWMIGGDLRGDIRTAEWTALAEAIREADPNHLMSYHPFGRTSSAWWFNDAPWLDFNMFQSGHRAYDQVKGDGDDLGQAAQNEDNWRYVADAAARTPRKPVIDAEPSYEGIPHGLHFPELPRWTAADVRRYAWWSVMEGAAGHTYGNNSVMQMLKPGYGPAYSAEKTWYEAQNDSGYQQMRHLKNFILALPTSEREPDAAIVVDQGERYDRIAAMRGDGWLAVYNYTGRPMTLDLSRIASKDNLKAWWYDPTDGTRTPAGDYRPGKVTFTPPTPGRDIALLLIAD